MGSRNERESVVVVERLRNILAESVTCTTRGYSPAASVVGVRPQQVAHWALVWHFLDAVKRSDVIKRVDAWGQTAVQTEDLVVDEGGQGEVVEEVCEVLPDVCVSVLSETLVVEAVDLGDLARLVVSTEDSDALRVSDLQGDEQGDRFDGKVASIDIITCAY